MTVAVKEMAENNEVDKLKLAFKKDGKGGREALADLFSDDIPSAVKVEDVNSAWNDLVSDIKKTMKFDIEIVDDIDESFEPHRLSPEDAMTKPSNILKKLDAKFNENLVKNPIAENAVIITLDAVTKLFEKKTNSMYQQIVDGLKDLVEISMKRDKIMALQKFEVLMPMIEELPPIDVKDTVFGAMVVFHDIFLNDILLF